MTLGSLFDGIDGWLLAACHAVAEIYGAKSFSEYEKRQVATRRAAGGSDTARYKALGNGMAQPCADYVIRRIVEVTADAQGDRSIR